MEFIESLNLFKTQTKEILKRKGMCNISISSSWYYKWYNLQTFQMKIFQFLNEIKENIIFFSPIIYHVFSQQEDFFDHVAIRNKNCLFETTSNNGASSYELVNWDETEKIESTLKINPFSGIE